MVYLRVEVSPCLYLAAASVKCHLPFLPTFPSLSCVFECMCVCTHVHEGLCTMVLVWRSEVNLPELFCLQPFGPQNHTEAVRSDSRHPHLMSHLVYPCPVAVLLTKS